MVRNYQSAEFVASGLCQHIAAERRYVLCFPTLSGALALVRRSVESLGLFASPALILLTEVFTVLSSYILVCLD
jgi:hypothetical protein